MARLEFLNDKDETLAHTEFSDELCRDTGNLGDVTEFNISALVERQGHISRYRIIAPFNQWSGDVVQRPQGVFQDGLFTLDNVDVNPSQQINVLIRGISDGDNKSNESDVEFTVALEDAEGGRSLEPEAGE